MPELGMSVPVVRQPRGPGSSGDRGFPAARKSSTPSLGEVSGSGAKEEPKLTKSKHKQKQNRQNQQVKAKSTEEDGLQLAHNLNAKERTEDVMTADNKDKEFADMLLSDPVLAGLKNAGFLKPSPIQLAAIPRAKVGFDLIVQSKSGTGKTAVYVVTALEMMQVEMQALQVLVIAPTREIATQGATVAMQIGAALPDLKMSAFIGGINVQEDKIKLKTCQMAVGTPGRVKQLLEEGFMQSSSIRLVCLDEADKLLEPSFLGDTTAILNLLPVNKQVIALSATYPEQLSKIAERFMRSPHHVRLGKECQVLAGVAQYVLEVEQSPVPARQNSLKHAALLNILSSVSYSQCLVFSNYQVIAQSTADFLNARGFPAIFISAGQDQQRRLQAISTFKKFNCRILCSTDLTARGIDAQNVNLVINLDVPWDHNTYLHRIGRGGRYGSLSVAISLAAKGGEMTALQRIVTKTGSNIRVLEEDIPKDLRAVKTKDLAVLEGVPVDENEDIKKASFKHKESTKDQNDEGEKKSGKVKRRGKKKGKANDTKIEEDSAEDKAKVKRDEEPSDELLDNVDSQSDDALTSAYELLQKHLTVKQNRNLEGLPSLDGINDLVKATVEGKSVNWNFINETDEIKDDTLKEEIGKAARIVSEHNKRLIRDKHNVAVEKMRNCNLAEMVEKLIAGENLNVEPEPTKTLNKSEDKPIASMAESKSNTSEDGTSDSESDSSGSSSSSDSSSPDSSSSDDEQSSGPHMSGYPHPMPGYPTQMAGYPPQMAGYPPQMAGYPPQMAGYPPQMAGYPPQMAGYPPQMAGYPPSQGHPQMPGYPPAQGHPQMPGYPPAQGNPQMAGYENWYHQWAASVRQQRDYIQYCHYWQQMQGNAKK